MPTPPTLAPSPHTEARTAARLVAGIAVSTVLLVAWLDLTERHPAPPK